MKFRSVADPIPIGAAEEWCGAPLGGASAYAPFPYAPSPRIIVAIPVRNEAEDIAGCLRALSGQRGATVAAVVLCLNNCTDDTAPIVRRVTPMLPGLCVHMLHVALAPDRACAGIARRIAMDRAADLAGRNGILLTTDADARVAPDWLAANLRALMRGADAVAGRALIEPEGARQIPRICTRSMRGNAPMPRCSTKSAPCSTRIRSTRGRAMTSIPVPALPCAWRPIAALAACRRCRSAKTVPSSMRSARWTRASAMPARFRSWCPRASKGGRKAAWRIRSAAGCTRWMPFWTSGWSLRRTPCDAAGYRPSAGRPGARKRCPTPPRGGVSAGGCACRRRSSARRWRSTISAPPGPRSRPAARCCAGAAAWH